MSIVLDIDVVVDGCRPDGGASHDLLVKIASGRLKPFSSPELHADYGVALQGAVLRREVRLTLAEAGQLLESFSYYVRSVDIVPRYIADVIVQAPELVHVVATARSAEAETIVTNRPDALRAVIAPQSIRIARPEDIL
jgi:predicted nucleic acid-binding protein